LVRRPYCGLPMWTQTYANWNKYYREQKGPRSSGYRVGRSGSMPCHVPDEQMGKIVEAIVSRHAWMDRWPRYTWSPTAAAFGGLKRLSRFGVTRDEPAAA